MRGLLVPEQEEDFTADPVELFFDLAFVFAFSQLVGILVHDHDWEAIGKATLILFLLWLPWAQFTWSANAVPGNQRVVRLGFLVATAASVPMAAAVTTAFDAGGALFAIPLSVIHLMALGVMAIGIDSESDVHTSLVRYATPNIVAVVLVVVGGFLEDGARVGCWIASSLVVIYATVRAGNGNWIIRPGHFAERHALIIIVALGEVIVALGNAVAEPLGDGEGFDARAVVALAATGVCAGLFWWAYFDRVQPAFEHRAEQTEARERGRFARDVYTYWHFAIVAGIILVAAALEDAALHPSDELPLSFRMMLLGGVALFLGGIGGGVYRAFHVIAKERLLALVVLVVVLALPLGLTGVVTVVVLDVVLVAALVAEHLRIEVRPSRSGH